MTSSIDARKILTSCAVALALCAVVATASAVFYFVVLPVQTEKKIRRCLDLNSEDKEKKRASRETVEACTRMYR